MIQRIQSIFFLLAGLAAAALLKVPFAVSDKPVPQLLSDQVYNVQDHVILIVLTIISAVIAVAAIFMYQNRELQMRLGYLVIVASILLLLVAFLLIYNEGTLNVPDSNIQDQFGLFLPFITILFSALAIRFVKKDEGLVRSMDRLR